MKRRHIPPAQDSVEQVLIDVTIFASTSTTLLAFVLVWVSGQWRFGIAMAPFAFAAAVFWEGSTSKALHAGRRLRAIRDRQTTR